MDESKAAKQDRFLNAAKGFALIVFDRNTNLRTTTSDFYIVWFSKTLKNWKALVSTDLVSGVYIEVTHNGEAGETYVDFYQKTNNTTFKY